MLALLRLAAGRRNADADHLHREELSSRKDDMATMPPPSFMTERRWVVVVLMIWWVDRRKAVLIGVMGGRMIYGRKNESSFFGVEPALFLVYLHSVV